MIENESKISSGPGTEQRPVKTEFEQRFLSRIPVRKNEGVSANICIPNSAAPLKLRVIDVSSIGIGLETEGPVAFSFQKGREVDLEIVCWANQYRLPCKINFVKKKSGGKTKIGCHRTDVSHPILSSKTLFKATTDHPLYYNEVVLIKVTDISTEQAVIE